jgi:hypothetical protein
LRDPVAPVADRFGGGFVHIHSGQLRQRHGHAATVPNENAV